MGAQERREWEAEVQELRQQLVRVRGAGANVQRAVLASLDRLKRPRDPVFNMYLENLKLNLVRDTLEGELRA